jgi:transforming growth factor-beta-induced protein
MSVRNSRSLLALAVAVSLSATACGGDDEADAPATTAPAATTAAPADTKPADTGPADTKPADTGPEDTRPAADGEAFGPACGSVPTDGEGSFAGMADDPAATAASNNPVLSTLVTAVTEAGLVDTLNSDGPFTIFAPTNDAFAKIPAADLEAVLADKDLLTSILTLHVVAGESLDAAALGEKGSAVTVNGETLEFSADGAMVNGINVVCSNVVTANATVHIIDTVLMPG